MVDENSTQELSDIDYNVLLLKSSGIFDETYYANSYPDLVSTDVDLYVHFVKYGFEENRRPNSNFSPREFAEQEGLDFKFSDVILRYSVQNSGKVDRSAYLIPVENDEKPIDDTVFIIKDSGLFSENYYRVTYPDIAQAYQKHDATGDDGLESVISHYVMHGAREGRNPHRLFSTNYYAEIHELDLTKVNPLAHFIESCRDGSNTRDAFFDGDYSIEASLKSDVNVDAPDVANVIKSLKSNPPIRCYYAPGQRGRLNIVTDSIGPSSLFGGVGTAIILGVLLANKLNWSLRIVTRTETSNASMLPSLFKSNNIKLNGQLDVVYMPAAGKEVLYCGAQDVFLTTSWWTTHSTRPCVPNDKLIYLLQEDERMFYASGDQSLMASEEMFCDDIIKVINTKLLYDHLLSTSPHPVDPAKYLYFEPAFPCIKRPQRVKKTPKKLFFYARPNNARNLFLRGIEALDLATSSGILNAENCELHFVGRDVPRMKFSNGVNAVFHEPMEWEAYKAFLSSMSGGFVLMNSPHPSYPPLDMASMGKPVLTNTFGLKQNLSMYSDLIICKQLDLPSLMEGFQELVGAMDGSKPLSATKVADSWPLALESTVEDLANRLNIKVEN